MWRRASTRKQAAILRSNKTLQCSKRKLKSVTSKPKPCEFKLRRAKHRCRTERLQAALLIACLNMNLPSRLQNALVV